MTRMQTFMEDTLAAARANGEKVSQGYQTRIKIKALQFACLLIILFYFFVFWHNKNAFK